MRMVVFTTLFFGGRYYFGSFETRIKMERIALAALNSPRTHGTTPAPVARLLDFGYDWIPSSEGMVVEGGELGRNEDARFLAGVPHSRQPVRPLPRPSYLNLFNERSLQAFDRVRPVVAWWLLQLPYHTPRISPPSVSAAATKPPPLRRLGGSGSWPSAQRLRPARKHPETKHPFPHG